MVYFVLIRVNFDVKFQEKNQETCGEALKSKTGEQNKGNRALHFKVQKFRMVESDMRKCIPRCEIPKAKFHTSIQGAKHPPGT